MMRGKMTLLGLSAAAIFSIPCRDACADEAADTATARILGGDGVMLADAGDCQQAVEKLRRAEALHHAATTAERLGECEINLGRLVAGTERLHRVVREPLGDGASPASVAAVARARTLLDQTQGRIPSVRVTVAAPPGAHFAVTMDGEPVPEATLGSDRPADPRAHKVQVSGDGFITATKDFSLSDGETKRISLRLDPDPNYKPAPPAEHDAQVQGPPHAALNPLLEPVTLTAIGVGGVGLLLGIGGGVYVATRSADLSKSCNSDKVCPADKQSEISSAKTWATVSTIGFAVAAGGLGTAAVLLLTGHKDSTGPSARAEVGPAYVGLSGRF